MIGPRGPINLGCPANMLAPLNQRLVAWWLVLPNNAGGRVLYDLTKNNYTGINNNGTLTNMSVDDWKGNLSRPGGWGCLNFDTQNANSGQRVVTAANNLMTSSPYTIALWVLSPNLTTSAGGRWIDVGNAAGPYLGQRDTAGSIRFVADFNTTDLAAVASTALASNMWTHIIVTWTGGIDANVDVVFYVNGVNAGHITGIETDAVGTEVTKAGTIKAIGNGSFSTAEAKAYIDDVRIYDRVLLPSEATALYHASAGGYVRELNRLRRFTLNEVAAGVTAKPFFYNRYVLARSR